MEDEQNLDTVAEQTIETRIDELVALDPKALEEDERKFLQENVDRLTDEEKQIYGFAVGDGGEGKGGTGEEEGKQTPIDAEKAEVRMREAFGMSDDGLDEAEKKIFEKVAAPIKAQQEMLLNQEIETLVQKNPVFEPYKAVIKKYATHEAYRSVDLEIIAKGLAFDDATKNSMKTGAQREKEANANNRQRNTPGRGARTPEAGANGEIPDVDNLNDKDFEKLVNNVKAGEFRRRR